MGKPGKGSRLAAWIVVISAVAGAALLAHTGLPHPRACAAGGVLVALSTLVWLLATTPGGAIRLPTTISEIVVLAGLVLLSLAVTRRVGFSPCLGAALVLLNHVRDRPGSLWPRIRAAPWLGNPWRLAPML